MRKFLFNGGFIGAVFGGFTAIQATRQGPRDWRLILVWLSWGISMALAVGAVIDESKNAQIER